MERGGGDADADGATTRVLDADGVRALVAAQRWDALARTLATDSRVSHVNLSGLTVGDQGVTALAAALSTNSSLTHLDLGANALRPDTGVALEWALQANHTLTRMDVTQSGLPWASAHTLETMVTCNRRGLGVQHAEGFLELLPALPGDPDYDACVQRVDRAVALVQRRLWVRFVGTATPLTLSRWNSLLLHYLTTLFWQRNKALNVLIVNPNAQHWSPPATCSVLLGCRTVPPAAIEGKVVEFRDDQSTDSRPTPVECQGHDHVVLGGTFDYLHAGHKVLLGMSVASAACSVTIGVTSDVFNASRNKATSELMEPQEARIARVLTFLRAIHPDPGMEFDVVPIDDPFGPSIVKPHLDAIVVSEETVRGGEAVNRKRSERGLSHLDLVVVQALDTFSDQSDGVRDESVSSSAIRASLLAVKQGESGSSRV